MTDFLRNNWFVVLVAIVILCFVGYFIYDNNKYNVSKMTDDGKEVIASIDGDTVTAEDLYNLTQSSDGEMIYNMYKASVIDQTIETTDDLQEQADTLESNIKSNLSSYSEEEYEYTILSEISSYGFTSIDDLNKYCLISVKEKEMNEKYVDKHFDELVDEWSELKPRTISIIKIAVEDPDNLTEEENTKKENIDNALEKESFADVAKAFTEDTNTASDKGFAGYIDSNYASSSSTTIPSDVVTAAVDMKKHETSDWITVSDSSGYSLYRVYINQTNPEKIYNSKNETVKSNALYSILGMNTSLENTILENSAKKLDIKFNDKDTKKKFNEYVKETFGGDE